jgi:hypothetical protein
MHQTGIGPRNLVAVDHHSPAATWGVWLCKLLAHWVTQLKERAGKQGRRQRSMKDHQAPNLYSIRPHNPTPFNCPSFKDLALFALNETTQPTVLGLLLDRLGPIYKASHHAVAACLPSLSYNKHPAIPLETLLAKV